MWTLFTSGSTFDLAHRQQIFMDSTKQRPLTSGLWLFERGPGRDGRVEDVEAKVSVPQISPLGESWQWLVSGPLPSFLQQFKLLKSLITLAPLSPVLHCLKSRDASWSFSGILLPLPWALETVSPLVMRVMFLAGRWRTKPLWILSSSLKGNSMKCSGKALNSPNPPSKEKLALHQPRIYLGSWKCFCFQRWFLIKWSHLVSFPVVPQEIDN